MRTGFKQNTTQFYRINHVIDGMTVYWTGSESRLYWTDSTNGQINYIVLPPDGSKSSNHTVVRADLTRPRAIKIYNGCVQTIHCVDYILLMILFWFTNYIAMHRWWHLIFSVIKKSQPPTHIFSYIMNWRINSCYKRLMHGTTSGLLNLFAIVGCITDFLL